MTATAIKTTDVIATISVPLEQSGAKDLFAQAPRRNFIDSLVLEKLESLNIPPSPRSSDEEFLRRQQVSQIILFSLIGLAVLMVSFIVFRLVSRELERRRRLAEEKRALEAQMLRENAIRQAEEQSIEVSMSVEERKRLDRRETQVKLQIIEIAPTHDEIAEFRRQWAARGVDHINVKAFDSWGGQIEEVSQLRPGERAMPARRFPCPNLWYHVHIYWDGTLVCCDRDFDARCPLGNVADGVMKAWRGPAMTRLRLKHLTFSSLNFTFCDGKVWIAVERQRDGSLQRQRRRHIGLRLRLGCAVRLRSRQRLGKRYPCGERNEQARCSCLFCSPMNGK